MKFEVRDLSEMPEKGSLTKALRLLTKEQAIFVPRPLGKPLGTIATMISSTAATGKLPFKIHTRVDYERNGVWAYRDGDTS